MRAAAASEVFTRVAKKSNSDWVREQAGRAFESGKRKSESGNRIAEWARRKLRELSVIRYWLLGKGRKLAAHLALIYAGCVILKVLLHTADEGGFWAEVPALPGCVSQGETIDE